MSIIKELEKYDLGEIKIKNIKYDSKDNIGSAEVIFPYSKEKVNIEFEGSTEKERVENLIENICCELDDMIDHLQDCLSGIRNGEEE